jgi:hypothetical protein
MTLPDTFIDHARCVLHDVLYDMLLMIVLIGAGWWPEVQADDAARHVHRPRKVRVM